MSKEVVANQAEVERAERAAADRSAKAAAKTPAEKHLVANGPFDISKLFAEHKNAVTVMASIVDGLKRHGHPGYFSSLSVKDGLIVADFEGKSLETGVCAPVSEAKPAEPKPAAAPARRYPG